ncbi:Notoamide biosynthesis cluster protein M' [Pseudocercospora fuligena]|uniref:Notoamide biosynthesis cluster protein M n=1 Tax=Pseudocercospora fuligena TaxID=685502 RepID=A0A8H6RRZ8_9PEZI|nr:Notoamide biosynthesis cluster protein M' [Pseudocercospora fuligena]
MSAFCEDESKWNEYFGALTGSSKDESINLRLFEWSSDSAYRPAEITVNSAAELITRDRSPHCDLRVVIARLSATQLAEHNAMQSIFRHYDFPTSFLSDRIQAVTHAFGARPSTKNSLVEIAWSHFLCKEVKSNWDEHQRRRGPYTDKTFTDSPRWRRCDAFLHVRSRDDGSRCVTLLCFGASQPLVERFNRLLANGSWNDAVKEPFLLFSIVYEDLYTQLDAIAWTLADVFRPVERSTLDRAGAKESSTMAHSVDFASLHNISKDCIYISEATEAAILTLDSMIAHLRSHRLIATLSMTDAALSHLTYRKLALQSTLLRVKSLEKRMANIISLSFNLVTQQDSRVMQNDSNAMKAIAVLTLIFLPLTGIGSLFSTPFFQVDFATSQKSLQVATCFWIFWVITVPLTLVMFVGWVVWYNSIKEKRTGKLDKKPKAINELGREDSRSWIDRLRIGK